jgi:hypothetical protein
MTLRQLTPELAVRFSRACLVAFYSAVALLGSGGLHAIAPRCHSGCCTAEPATTHTHHGCTHHRQGHNHAPAENQKQAPGRCPDGCLICEFAATPAVPVAVVILLQQHELVDTVTPVHELAQRCVAASPFWIRGPPSLG